jgi:hypothetical protein
MRNFLFGFILISSFFASAQEENGYSDTDLRTFILINGEIQAAKAEDNRRIDSLIIALPIDQQAWEEMLFDFGQTRDLESLKLKYSDQEYKSFYYIMSYKKRQKEYFPILIKKVQTKYGMEDDFFQHLRMRLENMPSLQRRLSRIQLEK